MLLGHLCRKLLNSQIAARVAALVFLVNPITLSTLTWISCFSYVLGTSLTLASLLAFWKSGAQDTRKHSLFDHFARERDTDLYFTFPERGEDCLALGTIADGVFGDYHYRHLEYKAYRQSVDEAYPRLQGGLRRNALENRLHPLEIALLSASIPPELFADVLGRDHSKPLFHRWRESALVEEDSRSGCLRLTANGSWFTSQMMAELSAP